MIIDTHLHEDRYSSDSFLNLYDAIDRAKILGLDGICVTNHENNSLKDQLGESTYINGILVIIGAEILTNQGDILVFGIDQLPGEKLDADELLNYVNDNNGVAIAAHPYRKNNRGLEDKLYQFGHLLSGVESFNGSTPACHNLRAFSVATELGLPSLGAGDSHNTSKVGTYATRFYQEIKNHQDFIEAIKSKNFHPVMRRDGSFIDIDYCYEELMDQKEILL